MQELDSLERKFCLVPLFYRRLITFVENFAPREKENVWRNEEEGVEE